MATSWADFLPNVRLEIPTAPNAVAVNAVRLAAIELCREAHVWREDLDKHHIIGGDGNIEIDVPANSELHSVLNVRFYPADGSGEREVKGPFDHKILDTQRPGWRSEENTGTTNGPEFCTVTGTRVLRLIPVPVVSQNDAIGLYVALKPTLDCTEGPDMLYDEYLEAVVAGALAKLYPIPDKPWTNLEHAADRRAQFAMHKADAKARVLRGSGTQPLSVHPRTLA